MYNPYPNDDKWNYVVARKLYDVVEYYCGGEGSQMNHDSNWTTDPDSVWVVHEIKTTAIPELYAGSPYTFKVYTKDEFIEWRKHESDTSIVL